MARLILSLGAAVLAVLFAVPLNGIDVGKLIGVVVDPSGAPIPGIELNLTNQATAEVWKTSSDATGHFEFERLPVGRYVLSAQRRGFEPARVTVKVGRRAAPLVRVRMELARLREKLTVRSDSLSSLSAQDNTDAIAINQSFLADLPIQYDQPLAVPSLFIDDAAMAMGIGKPELLVDGMPADNLDVPVISIQKVSINKDPYSAAYRNPGKGRIEISLKNHVSQHYHGAVTTVLQNSVFSARNAFSTSVPPESRVQSEAELEGPVTRNIGFVVSGSRDYHNEARVVNALLPNGALVENVVLPQSNTLLSGRLNFTRTAAGTTGVAYKYANLSGKNQGVGGFVLPEHASNYFFHQNDVRISDVKTWNNIVNKLLLGVGVWSENLDDVNQSPALNVPGAFYGGGAQSSRHEQNITANIEDVAALSIGNHTVQFGGGVGPRYVSIFNAANFGGTFTFPSLSDFVLEQPSLYTVNVGQPLISFNQYKFYAFVQDEFRLRPNFSLSYGLRRQWQSNVSYGGVLAPRMAFAYSPGGSHTVLRAGFGVFYGTQPSRMEEDDLLYDGIRIRKVDVSDPSFPSPFLVDEIPPTATPSVLRIAPNIRFPYLIQSNFSFEQQIGKHENFLTVDYTTLRGVGLYRQRNLNAPLPGTIIPPDPNFINFDQYETSASSRSNTLEVTFRSRPIKGLNLLAQYRFGKSMDNTGGFQSLPANNYDLQPEWGRADYDRRHRFNLAGTYNTVWDFRVGTILSLNSGTPYDVTTGYDNNHDTDFSDRPPGVVRNAGYGPAFADLDLRCSKTYHLSKDQTSQRNLEVGVDAFNALNHVNFRDYVGTMTSPYFGRAERARPGRQLQFMMRFTF
jgi:Carboxypeptidase regulatory-like domain